MAPVRAYAFKVLLVLWTALVGGSTLPALLLPRAASFAIQRWWGRGVIALLAWLFGIRHRIVGAERIPAGPVILAAKHQSAWDTVILVVSDPPPAFIIKQELARIPIYGWFCLKSGMIPVDRDGGAKALKAMRAKALKRAAEGRNIVIFPEGTRVTPGQRLEYQAGVVSLYKALQAPVVPVALNSGYFWPKAGLTGRRGVITLEYLEPIPPGLDKKQFLATLEERIESAVARLDPTET